MAALAAITAAVAVAVPAASASAAPTERTVSPRQAVGLFAPGGLYCDAVYTELRVAGASGNMWLTNYLSNVFVDSGCGGAAI
jgi:hypothetical protein